MVIVHCYVRLAEGKCLLLPLEQHETQFLAYKIKLECCMFNKKRQRPYTTIALNNAFIAATTTTTTLFITNLSLTPKIAGQKSN